MRRLGKKLEIAVISVGVVVLAAALSVYGLSQARLGKVYEFAVALPDVPADPQLAARGLHLAHSRGCADCHSADLGGKVFFDESGIALVSATNLTSGVGGIAASYSEGDWDRAIRHGVGRDGRALWIMPSAEYFGFSDADVSALVAYFRAAPPVDRELPAKRVGPLGRMLLTAGLLSPFSAEHIDHAATRAPAPPEGATVEYGRYLAAMCAGCHGANFAGRKAPGPPGSPAAPNLTAHAGGLGGWTETDFVSSLRYGQLPDGRIMLNEFMPWSMTASMTEAELTAIWLYLRSLPPVATGST
ncbi:MAG: c-type cytochrome [Pseudomonadales bacterium]